MTPEQLQAIRERVNKIRREYGWSQERIDTSNLLDEIERLRGALENVKYPVNHLSSSDALEYHADVCKTVDEALDGETV